MAEIVRDANFTIEQYVLRNIYVLVVIYQSNNALIPTGYATWAHDDIRTCLFDMNMDKNDIVFSLCSTIERSSPVVSPHSQNLDSL
jgi:hypothetical protein